MANPLPVPVPVAGSEATLLRDSEEALERSRELLPEIETMLAFRFSRRVARTAGDSLSSSPGCDSD